MDWLRTAPLLLYSCGSAAAAAARLLRLLQNNKKIGLLWSRPRLAMPVLCVILLMPGGRCCRHYCCCAAIPCWAIARLCARRRRRRRCCCVLLLLVLLSLSSVHVPKVCWFVVLIYAVRGFFITHVAHTEPYRFLCMP